jgi:hypothetical protein
MFDTGGPPNPLTVNKCHFWPWIPANPAFPVRNSPPAPLVIVCMPPCLLEMMFAEPRIGRYLLQAS